MSKEFLILGKVQGVGFRSYCKYLAKKYGMFGWVKNNKDGSVSLRLEGKDRNGSRFLDHLKSFFREKIQTITEVNKKYENFNDFKVIK